ncbi:hypothetical protein FA365_06665, partial [Pseudomonas aeruginosa]|nr:hypothetical protein [Pseudomonas aeruginosa]
WHRDYAAESLKRAETSRWTQDANLEWTQLALECAQVVHLARQVGEELGNEKIIGIADTVPSTIEAHSQATYRRPCYKRITTAQTHLLAVTLLERFGSARRVANAVWQLTDDEIDQAKA